MSAGAIIPIAIRRAERRVIERLRDSGADSYATAQPLTDLRLFEEQRLRRMLAAGAIRETAAGEYFLDEAALEDYSQQRRKKVLLIVGGAAAALLAVIGLNRK